MEEKNRIIFGFDDLIMWYVCESEYTPRWFPSKIRLKICKIKGSLYLHLMAIFNSHPHLSEI